MGTRNLIIIILIVGVFTITGISCKKGGLGCLSTVYNFKINANAFPDKDSLKIGDTLWIEVTCPTILTDLTSNKSINYSGTKNLGIAISFDIFKGGSISDPGTNYAASNFNYSLTSGTQINNSLTERVKEYLFLENSNMYVFKLGVIPKVIGIFAIGISNSVNVYRQSDNCTKANFEIIFDSNTDQHLYLYQNNRPGYLITDYETKHAYCFKVYK